MLLASVLGLEGFGFFQEVNGLFDCSARLGNFLLGFDAGFSAVFEGVSNLAYCEVAQLFTYRFELGLEVANRHRLLTVFIVGFVVVICVFRG